MKTFFWVLFLFVVQSFAFDASGSFVQSYGGHLSVMGLPGFYSTPARIAAPAFGINASYLSSTDQASAGVAGEIGDSLYRVAFLGGFESMDSIYRRVYTEWDLAFRLRCIVLGAGYGLSVEWIPAEESWVQHRYKAGGSLLFGQMSLSAMAWNYSSDPISYGRYLLGLSVKPGNDFDGFVEWNGSSVFMGTSVQFGFVCLTTAYRMPGFSVVFALEFSFGPWSVNGYYGKMGLSLDWFGGGVQKKIKKKTIL